MIRWPVRRRMAGILAVLAVTLLAAGCDTVGYYYQSIGGHLGVMASAQSLDDAIATARPATDAARVTFPFFTSGSQSCLQRASFYGSAHTDDLATDSRRNLVWSRFVSGHRRVQPGPIP